MLSYHSMTVCCGHLRTAVVHPAHYLSHPAISLVYDVHAGGRIEFFWGGVTVDRTQTEAAVDSGEGTKIFHSPVQQIYTRLCSSPNWRACLGRCPATEASLLKEKCAQRRDNLGGGTPASSLS